MKPKQIKATSIGIVLVFLLVLAAEWILGAGTLAAKPLNLGVLDDANPARRELGVKAATLADVTVESIDDYKTFGVLVSFDDCPYPDVRGRVWLSGKDIARIDPGDRITVRGQFKYYEYYNSFTFETRKEIVIGNAISVFPYTFDARLVSIEKMDMGAAERGTHGQGKETP